VIARISLSQLPDGAPREAFRRELTRREVRSSCSAGVALRKRFRVSLVLPTSFAQRDTRRGWFGSGAQPIDFALGSSRPLEEAARVDRGIPSLAAAPFGLVTFPLLSARVHRRYQPRSAGGQCFRIISRRPLLPAECLPEILITFRPMQLKPTQPAPTTD
jgi:hypothetical protein